MAALLLICTSPLAAEDKAADNMQLLIAKVKADKKLIVANNLQLTEKEAKAFWPVYESYQNELFLLRSRSLNMIKNYADNYETMTNAMAKKLLDEFMTIETLRVKLAKTYLPQFRKVLSDKKVARYYQIENKINAVLYYELAAQIPYVKTGNP
ncbi:MAG: hypothetical protein HGA29_04830 [Syntrophaceae bacterium]|nr:hypothetical protein [Syntrophaceae bacterium]